MKNTYFLKVCFLCAASLTITAAFFDAKNRSAGVVSAQGPGGGCFSTLPPSPEICTCDSTSASGYINVADISGASGVGHRSALVTPVICNTGIASCSGYALTPQDDI